MKDQFHPVRSNAECERIISGTCQGVLSMSRREYDEFGTDYWYWEKKP